ncbi:helix-turn-helix domain-containing protein [Rhodococcus qingshengii]|uniref:helix-turn-helix domain-containing protein n=1 Tax=Rhodococcus qingshengii TaxID=334542 RepID=UPI0030185C89
MAAWTDEESARLTELHAAGKSLNFIATDMQRSKETIGRHSERLGLSFDRTATAKAAEAVHVDNKARRALLESRLLTEAEKVIEQLWTPAIVYSFGGQFNEYAEHELDKPTFSDQKAIMQTASTAITASNKLHEMNAGQNTDHAKSMLVQMQEALLKAVEAEEGGE